MSEIASTQHPPGHQPGRFRRLDVMSHPGVAHVVSSLRESSRAIDPAQVVAAMSGYFTRVFQADYFVTLSTRDLPAGSYRITRRYGMASSERERLDVRASDTWRNRLGMEVRRGGILGTVIERAEPQVLTELAIDHDEVLGSDVESMRSLVAVPHYDGGEARNWVVSFMRSPQPPQLAELERFVLTSSLAGRVAGGVAVQRELREANAKLEAHLEEVARVQMSLLPAQTPLIPGLEIATSYLTSLQAGGDYFDFFPIGEAAPASAHSVERSGSWGMLIADVSGHGPAAATVMAMLHAIVHAYHGKDRSPEAVMRFANERLCASNLSGSFVTAFFAVYDPMTGVLRYSRMGHNPPRLKLGASGDVRALDGAGGIPLGVMPDAPVRGESISLQPMDTLVLYTDGVVEAFDAQRRMFGVEGLDAALARCTGEPQCVIATIHEQLHAHTQRMTRDDDQTIVAIRCTACMVDRAAPTA